MTEEDQAPAVTGTAPLTSETETPDVPAKAPRTSTDKWVAIQAGQSLPEHGEGYNSKAEAITAGKAMTDDDEKPVEFTVVKVGPTFTPKTVVKSTWE